MCIAMILAQLLVTAGHVDHHADLGTVDAHRRKLALRLNAHKATDRHVLADLANQRGTRRLDGAFTHRQCRQRSHVGRVLGGDHVRRSPSRAR
jgi:hypothetical protein